MRFIILLIHIACLFKNNFTPLTKVNIMLLFRYPKYKVFGEITDGKRN